MPHLTGALRGNMQVMALAEGAIKAYLTRLVRAESWLPSLTPYLTQQATRIKVRRASRAPPVLPRNKIRKLQTGRRKFHRRPRKHPSLHNSGQTSTHHTIAAKRYRNGKQRARLPALWHRLQHRQNKGPMYHITTSFTQSRP